MRVEATARSVWLLLAAFLVGLAVFGFLQYVSPGLAGNDGYYHIAMAAMIRENGLRVFFPYLEFTLLDSRHFVDMHLLFHLLQAPFTAWMPLATAAKTSAALFAAAACTLFVYVLDRHRIPLPLLWLLLLLASSSTFLYRMSMPRPPVLAWIYMLLFFHFQLQRRFLPTLLTALLFTWTYKLFPVLIPLALFAMFVTFVHERRLDPRPLIAVVAGMVAGLLINPYFPDNIVFLVQAVRMKVLALGFGTRVGNEWYPYDTLHLLRILYLPLALWTVALLLTDRRDWRRDPARLFWFLTATMWLLLLLKSRRFIEFFPPAAVLFFAFSVRDGLRRLLHEGQRRLWGWAFVALLVLAVPGIQSLQRAQTTMLHRTPVDAYRGAAVWLKEHTPPGARVFNTDWDDFPRLFFHNRRNIYIVGLDPDYMRLKDPGLYKLWRLISKGRIPHPEEILLHTFDSAYVFTDIRHHGFLRMAASNRRLRRVYGDRYAIVYEVLETRAEYSKQYLGP